MNRRERRKLIYPEALRLFLSILSFALVALLMMNLQIFSDRAFHASILEENQLLLKKVRSATPTNDTKIMEERWQSVFRLFYHEAPLFDRGFYCFPDWSDCFPMLVDVALQTFIWSTFIIHFVFPLPRCIFPWQLGKTPGCMTRLKNFLAQFPCFFARPHNNSNESNSARATSPDDHVENAPSITASVSTHHSRPKYKCSWLFIKNRNRFRLAKLYRLVVVRRIFWILAIIFLLRSFCFTCTAVPNPKPWCEYQYPKPNPSSVLNVTGNHHHDYINKVQKDEKENCPTSGNNGCGGTNENEKWKKETMAWLRILGHMMTGEASACTDNIFSGHAAITMTCLWTWLWYQRGPAIFQIPCRRKKKSATAATATTANKNVAETENSMESSVARARVDVNVDAKAPSRASLTPFTASLSSSPTTRNTSEYGQREPIRAWSFYALLHAFLILFLIIATHLHYTVDVILSVIISSAVYYIYHFAASYAESKARKEMRKQKDQKDDHHNNSHFDEERLTFPWPYYLCVVIGWMDGVDLRVKREVEAEADEEEGGIGKTVETESSVDDCEGLCDEGFSRSSSSASVINTTRTNSVHQNGQASVV